MLDLLTLFLAAAGVWLATAAMACANPATYPLPRRPRRAAMLVSLLLTIASALTFWRHPQLLAPASASAQTASVTPSDPLVLSGENAFWDQLLSQQPDYTVVGKLPLQPPPLWLVTIFVCVFAVFFLLSLCALVTDYLYQILPNRLNLGIWLVALLLLLLLRWQRPLSMLGIILLAGACTLVALLGNIFWNALGMGDVKLIGALVIILAAFNAQLFFLAGIGFCVFAAVSAVFAAARNNWSWKTRFAFGPTLILATYTGLFPYIFGFLFA